MSVEVCISAYQTVRLEKVITVTDEEYEELRKAELADNTDEFECWLDSDDICEGERLETCSVSKVTT